MRNKIQNLLQPRSKKRYAVTRKKVLIWAGSIVGSVLLIGGALFALYRTPVQAAYRNSLQARDNFLAAQDFIIAQDFSSAQPKIVSAVEQFTAAQTELKKFSWLRVIPFVGTQVQAIDSLLSAGISTGESISTINELAYSIITPLQKNEDISLNSLSEEETRQLLQSIFEAKPELEEAKRSIDTAVEYVNAIPERGLISKIKDAVNPIKEKVPLLQSGIDRAISASQIIPSIAGYPNRKTYLFLLQNNDELRPTGGFIGTYGILKVGDGDIKYFQTDNSYNLDTPAEEWLSVDPPQQLTRYNAVYQWFFRDSNWSPDFPTTAQKAEEFYHLERGPEKNIDGIISVTPTFIQSLLTLTGQIDASGVVFTSDNLVDTLQYQVEQGFLRQGITESDRKEIIGSLSEKLLEKILDLPKSKWPDLWTVFSKDIQEKKILMYVKDAYIQDYIEKENWGGHVVPSAGDYALVVDANLASLKTDQVMQRSIEYLVRKDGGNLIADLSIRYKNEGKLTWKTTRYRTYTRIYVPEGATLLKTDGAMVDCKNATLGNVDVGVELQKTVFGAFICIEPGEEGTLHFKYKLPEQLTKQFNQGSYSLLFQKQPGTKDYPLRVKIQLGETPKSAAGLATFESTDHSGVAGVDTLSQDKNLLISY